MPVKIVTDSTADLPSEIINELGTSVVPIYLRIGTEVYRDGVDISHGGPGTLAVALLGNGNAGRAPNV